MLSPRPPAPPRPPVPSPPSAWAPCALPGNRRGSGGDQEGIYRSSVDARKPQNPTCSEEHQGHLQGVLYIV
eukprot:5811698-Pyramimonas_sp.AAC.1